MVDKLEDNFLDFKWGPYKNTHVYFKWQIDPHENLAPCIPHRTNPQQISRDLPPVTMATRTIPQDQRSAGSALYCGFNKISGAQ